MEKKMKLTLLCDDREKAVIKELQQYPEVEVIVKRLTIGDFIISERKAYERKRGDDLVSTMIDGREEEFIRLKEAYPEATVIIEDLDLAFSSFYLNLSADRIYGFMSKIVDKEKGYGLAMVPTRDSKDTARFLVRAAIREQTNKEFTGVARHKPKFELFKDLTGIGRMRAIRKYQLWFLQGIIGIGKILSKRLLTTFKTPWAILNAYGTTNIKFLHGQKRFNKTTKLSKVKDIGVQNVWNNREMLLTNTYKEET